MFSSSNKKGLPNFHLKIKHMIKYCISSCWLLSQIRFLLWIMKPQGGLTLALSLSMWSLFPCRSMADTVISHWILRFYEWFLNLKKKQTTLSTSCFYSQAVFYRGIIIGFGSFKTILLKITVSVTWVVLHFRVILH